MNYLISVLGAGILAGALFLYLEESAILIESRESKTIQGGPVFNKIKKISAPGKTIWMMQQSHEGKKALPHQWERIAIVVDEKKTAEYFQLESGDLNWKENLPQAPLKVACYLCHSNGPRLIRPNFNSAEAPLSLKDQARIWLWNREIKNSGRIKESLNELEKDRTTRHGQNKFRFRDSAANVPLQLKTCLKCHNEESRGSLTRQNFLSIKFLVKEGLMPPSGHLTAEDRKAIDQFVGN